MKIIQSGSNHKLHSDDLVVIDSLPAGVYNIEFNPMAGYSLVKRENFETPDKIYGETPRLVDKMIKRYMSFDKNFGTILTGRKGTGKSMASRLVSNMLIEQGIPTILVSENTPDIAGFLASIKQRALILFDEFEKTFPYSQYNDGRDEQAQFLGLFDGIVNNRHFYLVTINEERYINPYFLGRTGRFYYKFNFGDITIEEITEVLKDQVTVDVDIADIARKLNIMRINHDQLNAVVAELNFGETIDDIIKYVNLDLSMIHEARTYEVAIQFKDGETRVVTCNFATTETDYCINVDLNYNDNFEDINLIGDIDMRGALPKLSLPTRIEPYDTDNGTAMTVDDIVSITATPYAGKIARLQKLFK